MEKLVLSEKEVSDVCEKLANQMDEQIEKDGTAIPIFLGVMNGALPFLYELVKHVKHPNQIDLIKCSSYHGTKSTGEISVSKEPDHSLEGKDVYIIEDIIDTGLTMHFLKEYIREKYKPRKLYVVILCKRVVKDPTFEENADFTGFFLDDPRYIVGYGFDYFGLGRSIPYIFVPSEEDKKNWEKLLKEDDPNFGK